MFAQPHLQKILKASYHQMSKHIGAYVAMKRRRPNRLQHFTLDTFRIQYPRAGSYCLRIRRRRGDPDTEGRRCLDGVRSTSGQIHTLTLTKPGVERFFYRRRHRTQKTRIGLLHHEIRRVLADYLDCPITGSRHDVFFVEINDIDCRSVTHQHAPQIDVL